MNPYRIALCLLTFFLILPGSSQAKPPPKKTKKATAQAALPMMPTLPGFRRVVEMTNQTASNQGLQTLSGEQTYVVYPKPEKDKRNRNVYVAEIKCSLNGGQYQSDARLYFSFAPDGTRRIHGIQKRNTPLWFSDDPDNKEGYLSEIPGKISVGSTFPVFDLISDLECPLYIQFQCVGQETISTPVGVFKTYRCVGKGEITQETPFGKITAPETFVIFIAPKVGIVKYSYLINSQLGQTKVTSLYQQEARSIGRGNQALVGSGATGTKFRVVQVRKTCSNCGGDGKTRCNECQGTGRPSIDPSTYCEACSGTGRSRYFSCSTCQGRGYVLVSERQPIGQ